MAGTVERLGGLLRCEEGVEAGAAVAVLLNPAAEGLRVLLVKRSADPSDPWSGQMALPGGRRRPGDRSLMETVIRETAEETGMDLRPCRFLGTLDVAASKVERGLSILPFVAVCEGPPEVKLNRELSAYLWVPLDRLRRCRGVAVVRGREVPAFVLEDGVVWGITYRILENLFGLLDEAGVNHAP